MRQTKVNLTSTLSVAPIEERKRMILSCYRKAGQPLTDREVKCLLGFSDMNMVRPRITELVAEGKLNEAGTIKCNTTGRNVRLCEVANG